jgi:hypothetical protein
MEQARGTRKEACLGPQKGRFSHKNREKSQKNDVSFGAFLLITKELLSFFTSKVGKITPCIFLTPLRDKRAGGIGEAGRRLEGLNRAPPKVRTGVVWRRCS